MKPATSFDEFYRQIRLRKVAFFVTFFAVILVSYSILYVIDFIPEEPGTHPVDVESTVGFLETETVEAMETNEVLQTKEKKSTPEQQAAVDSLPNKIIIDKLDREIKILNTKEATIEAMDADLKKGVVRHPDSADFNNVGNIFLLGHSSYIPNVLNKNYQAFNGIEKLTWGDKIRLQSEDTEYIYRVDTVTEEKSTDAVVPYTWGEAKLTLVTCKVLGAIEDRFVVVATLIETRPL